MELKLQKINPDFFFPYWDEGADHLREESSPHWQYAGTSGMPVKNGFLGNRNLSPNEILARNFTMKDLNDALPAREIFASFYQKSITYKEGYAKWWPDVNLYHGLLHNKINGQMFTPRSPVDPLFYLHHSYYDKLFDDAQKGWKFEGAPTSAFFDKNKGCDPDSPLPGYGNKMADVLDSAVNMCVRYAPRVFGNNPPIVQDKASSLNKRELENLNGAVTKYNVLAVPNVDQGYGLDYIPMNQCPPKLTMEFKMIMGGNITEMEIMEEQTRSVCEETLRKIESGISIPKIPRFTFENRPVIADGSEGTVANHIEVESNYHLKFSDSSKKESDVHADGKASEDRISGENTSINNTETFVISSCFRNQNIYEIVFFVFMLI
jgi:tyrosinase